METTKERAARCDRATHARRSSSLPAYIKTRNPAVFPKKERLGLAQRMMNEASDLVADLMEANDLLLTDPEERELRYRAQRSALRNCRKLIHHIELAHEILSGFSYDAAGAESAYTTSVTRTVTNNRPPVISGTDSALGSFSTAAPSYEYTVTDADGHQVDVVEMLDGVTLRSYTVTLGQTNTLTIGSEAWLKVVNGSHTLKIVATDAKDASVTRTLTFTKAVTSVEFEQTLAMEADAMPTKALVNIQGNFPAGCTLQVWICNNGNDASPTWEDITQKARTGQKHYFTNQTKTAAAWGVKVKAKLLRGSATETCYIQSIGGNFA